MAPVLTTAPFFATVPFLAATPAIMMAITAATPILHLGERRAILHLAARAMFRPERHGLGLV